MRVLVQDHKIRFLTRFKTPDLLLQAIRLRRPDRHAAQGLLTAKRILRLKTTRGITLGINTEYGSQKGL